MSVSTWGRGPYVTITHDALDFTVQPPPQIRPRTEEMGQPPTPTQNVYGWQTVVTHPTGMLSSFAVFLMVLAITPDPLCRKIKKKTEEIVTEGTEIGIVIVTGETVTEIEIATEIGTGIETAIGTEETGIGTETGKRKGHILRSQQRRYYRIYFHVFVAVQSTNIFRLLNVVNPFFFKKNCRILLIKGRHQLLI